MSHGQTRTDPCPTPLADNPIEILPQGSLASEPGAAGQWHLRNTGQAGGSPGIDINVLRAWESATGQGVRIGIIDDGFDLAHPDLAANFQGGWDSRGNDATPMAEAGDTHGTATAGLIGADDNGSGLLGVAHDATLLGFRIGFGAAGTGAQVIDALTRQAGVDVSSNSWGYTTAFTDDFANAGFAPIAAALANAATVGRDGLGTVWVFAAGNARQAGDNVNQHNLQNSQYAIAVAALDSAGRVASFSTPGAAVLVSAPGVAVLTTDATGAAGYAAGDSATLNGTSFATPLVAGVVGLMLQAEAGLGYRDVQDILAYSARPVDLTNPGWTTNAARDWNGGALRFSNDHGFGLLDATAALRLAETWFATGAVAQTAANRVFAQAAAATPVAIPDLGSVSQSLALGQAVRIDRVEVAVDLRHSWRGDVSLTLVAPSGTESVLLYRPGLAPGAAGYGSSADNIVFTLGSHAFRGENAAGTWTLRATDHASGLIGTLNSWSLSAIGEAWSADDRYVFTDAFATLDVARRTLADAGGIDTLNLAAVTAACVIDLDGLACSIGATALTIAPGTVIEHAIGGDGADRITGNQLANILWGGRGDDTLLGGGGDDTLKGGLGHDRLEGGEGIDRALFDLDFAAFTYAWDGTLLLLAGAGWTDLLLGIEVLGFTDQDVLVASLAPPPPPPPPPEDLPASIVLTNTTAAGAGFAATAPAPGSSLVLGAAALGLSGLAATTSVTLATDADGAFAATLTSAWNTLKAVRLTDTDGGEASLANFVEVAVTMGGSAASTLSVTEAKRGSIITGSGDDAITLRAFSNASGADNAFSLDSGAGHDTLALAGWKNWTRFTVALGEGNDRLAITGASADTVDGGTGDDRIDTGGGNDRVTGGIGRDVFVFRTGAGRDVVTDFLTGTDALEFSGVAAAAVRFAASTAGLVVSWGGTDTVTLAGLTLAQASLVDLIFA